MARFQAPQGQGDPFAANSALLSQLGSLGGNSSAAAASLGRQMAAQRESQKEQEQQIAAGMLAPKIAEATTTTLRMEVMDSPKFGGIFRQPGALGPGGAPTAQTRGLLRQAMIADGWEDGPALDLTVESALVPQVHTHIEEGMMSGLAQEWLSTGGSPGGFATLMETISPGTVVGQEGVIEASRRNAQKTFGAFTAPQDDIATQVAKMSLNDEQRQALGHGAAIPGAAGEGDFSPTRQLEVSPELFSEVGVNPAFLDVSVNQMIETAIPGATPDGFINGTGAAKVIWEQAGGLVAWDVDANRLVKDEEAFRKATDEEKQAANKILAITDRMLQFAGREWSVKIKGQSRSGAVEQTATKQVAVGKTFGTGAPVPVGGYTPNMKNALESQATTDQEALDGLEAGRFMFDTEAFRAAYGND